MSLDNILADIKDDVTSIDIATEGLINTTESFNTANKDSTYTVINLKCEQLSQEFRDKLSKFYNLVSIKNNIDKLSRVDRSIATEVFTMLPDLSKVEEAKLTSSPSVINKEILSNVLNTKINYTVIDELNEKINPIKEEIEENRSNINFIKEYLLNFKEVTANDYSRLLDTPPIVIINKDSINLLTCSIRDIAYNNVLVNYNKYDTDAILAKKYLDLYKDNTLQDYFNSDIKQISLQQIYQKLISDLDSIEYKTKLFDEFINLTSELKADNEVSSKLLNIAEGSDVVIEYLKWFKTMFAIVNTQDNFIEKTKDLLAFLD